MSVNAWIEYLRSWFSPIPAPAPAPVKEVYLFQYANLEDYKMRNRPYTSTIYTDVNELITAVKRDLEHYKNEMAECPDALKGWTFFTDVEVEQKIRELKGGFDYVAYSADCTQAFWVSKCSLA